MAHVGSGVNSYDVLNFDTISATTACLNVGITVATKAVRVHVDRRVIIAILIQVHTTLNWIPAQEPPQGVAIVPRAVVLEAGFGIERRPVKRNGLPKGELDGWGESATPFEPKNVTWP